MWNENKSILLSKLAVITVMVAIPILGLFLPAVTQKFLYTSAIYSSQVNNWTMSLIIPYGLMALPGLVLMTYLFKLLRNIEKDELFVDENVSLLRRISWLCFLIATISLIATWLWWAWGILTASAVLIGLLVRVIKNIFARAIALKKENDLTI